MSSFAVDPNNTTALLGLFSLLIKHQDAGKTSIARRFGRKKDRCRPV